MKHSPRKAEREKNSMKKPKKKTSSSSLGSGYILMKGVSESKHSLMDLIATGSLPTLEATSVLDMSEQEVENYLKPFRTGGSRSSPKASTKPKPTSTKED